MVVWGFFFYKHVDPNVAWRRFVCGSLFATNISSHMVARPPGQRKRIDCRLLFAINISSRWDLGKWLFGDCFFYRHVAPNGAWRSVVCGLLFAINISSHWDLG